VFRNENPDFLNVLHKQEQNHLETMKQFAEMGKALAAIEKALTPKTVTELVTLQTYEQTFRDNGYTFNSVYVSDAAHADNAALVVTISGVSYTVSLIPGENELNLPDGATYKVTTTSGKAVTALLTRYNTLR
jgi:hypothetical protein